MNCHQLQNDINRFKEELEHLKGAVKTAVSKGVDKDSKAAKALKTVSNTYNELLALYYHDIRVENLKDPNHSNTEFLKSLTSFLPETKHPLPPETTIDQVRGNIEKYLEDDPRLDSNLLTYALQEKVIEALRASNKLNQTETLSSTNNQPNIHLQDIVEILKDIYPPTIPETGNISRNTYLTIIAERVKNLETYETKHYIFMLPKDKWDDNRILLPENTEGAYLAPTDLTAILKEPVYFDWREETGGRTLVHPIGGEAATLVYDSTWTNQEISRFPLSIELLETEAKFLKPNGYSIPTWSSLTFALRSRYIQMNQKHPLEAISNMLIEEFHLGLSGVIIKSDLLWSSKVGRFWSICVGDEPRTFAESMRLDTRQYNIENFGRPAAMSVRCIYNPESPLGF